MLKYKVIKWNEGRAQGIGPFHGSMEAAEMWLRAQVANENENDPGITYWIVEVCKILQTHTELRVRP